MFEEYIDKRVDIIMMTFNQEQELWAQRRIVEVDGYLIKLEDKQIINTASPAFVSLELTH